MKPESGLADEGQRQADIQQQTTRAESSGSTNPGTNRETNSGTFRDGSNRLHQTNHPHLDYWRLHCLNFQQADQGVDRNEDRANDAAEKLHRNSGRTISTDNPFAR